MARDPSEERQELVYKIETSWYGGNHPLTFSQHQKLTNKHKELLREYREKTRADFSVLEREGLILNEEDIFSEESLAKANTFSRQVFEASRKCSEGFARVSGNVVESSVNMLKSSKIDAPCKFAVVALGSVAKGEATPYSDLEYAFIVEQNHEYFQNLAVDTYFRINNFGETPLKCFDIDELKDSPGYATATTGYKIDGITKSAGNIPTGNGKTNGQSLTLTVDEFMELYRKESESVFDGKPGDKSDMLSSTVVIFTNEEGDSQLHKNFEAARAEYEQTLSNQAVFSKRLETFAIDVDSYSFAPDFVRFQPPENLNLEIKKAIFRYPTLLANNIKVCQGWGLLYSWDIYSRLRNEGILDDDTLQYILIVLALSLYLRTSTYLSQMSQTKFVTLQSRLASNSKPSPQLPSNLFTILGCLLTPIKRAVESGMKNRKGHSLANIIKSIFSGILIDKSDHLLKSEVYYFSGQYHVAQDELSKAIGVRIGSITCSTFVEKLSSNFPQVNSPRKYLELCCYLFYYTRNYKCALDYFDWLINTNQGDIQLWRLLAAHCRTEIGDYQTAVKLVNKVRFCVQHNAFIDSSSRACVLVYCLVYQRGGA